MTLSVKANKYLYLLYLEPIQHSQPPEENRAALFLKIFHQIHIFTSPTLYQKNRYFRLYAFCPYLYGKYRSNKDRKPTVGADNGNTCNPGPAETEKPEIKFWRCSHLSLSLQKIGCASENREQVPVFSRLSYLCRRKTRLGPTCESCLKTDQSTSEKNTGPFTGQR